MLIPVAFPRFTPRPAQFAILAGDVGATKTNLAVYYCSGEDLFASKKAHYKTKDYPDLKKMITYFLNSEKMPDIISLGVAGPVRDGNVSITNIPLDVNGSEISDHFNHVPVVLINDLEATAYGLSVLNPKDISVINEGKKDTAGNIAIIAPGTGLGEAGLYWDRNTWHPFATEGGHCDFSPRTEMDTEIYNYLHKKFGHVSWERLISGPGICNIYDFLVKVKEREVPPWLTEKMLIHDHAIVISENADSCSICKEAIDLFIRYLAEESANLVLKLKATGGLFIGGGILPKILHLVQKDIFLKYFCDSGRLKTLLQDVAVKVILNEETALLGAAWYGAYSK
ncbi:glucokinase [Niastella vici]|uniref:Glucokinase n=1 Tax=Niastella vici TaxID=1703345 RepID=A0A1V9G026_9BACT|nr:glucokinase [Niastella vici]OQP63846.1 glucokinase [Niastella vici]